LVVFVRVAVKTFWTFADVFKPGAVAIGVVRDPVVISVHLAGFAYAVAVIVTLIWIVDGGAVVIVISHAITILVASERGIVTAVGVPAGTHANTARVSSLTFAKLVIRRVAASRGFVASVQRTG